MDHRAELGLSPVIPGYLAVFLCPRGKKKPQMKSMHLWPHGMLYQFQNTKVSRTNVKLRKGFPARGGSVEKR